MNTRWAVFFLLLIAPIPVGCQHRDALNPPVTPEVRIISGSGFVAFASVEGGCWTIQSDDGQVFEPVGLADEFKRDGLAVQFVLKTLPDVVSACMTGPPVEIMELQAVSGP